MLTIKNCPIQCFLVTHSHLQAFLLAPDLIATENNLILKIFFVVEYCLYINILT